MTRIVKARRTAGLVLVLAGVYVAGFGSGQGSLRLGATTVEAQDAGTLSEETRGKIKAAADAMNAAVESLKLDQQYTTVTKGINTFGVLTGGINALKDLEEGRGVDPETFAALYAGLASDEIASKIGRDTEGRVTYNGRLIRMYPVSRIKSLYGARATVTGEDISAELEGKKPAKKKEEPAAESN